MTLLEAIEAQNLPMLIRLLARDPNSIDDLDEQGIPMSFRAAKTGNFGLVRHIVEYSRASMNTTDQYHRNILHYAAMSGNVSLAAYLVEKVGMSIVAGDKDLITPYDIAKEYDHQGLIAYFEKVCGFALEEAYRNPIRTGMFPDPSIVRVEEDYYMVNSSFVFFPCIPISHSKDLIHWKIIGYAITEPEWALLDDLEGGRGYWAPDISYHNGVFTIAATYRLNDTGTVYRKQMVVTSEKPEGPYSKPVFIDEDGIDPSIFNDDDGRRYMLLNRGARIFELDQSGTEQISKATLLYYGSQKRAPEGPHILKKDGYYYLFLAEGGTGPGHRITVARSKELHGNYEPCPYNPIMRQKDENAAIQRCGHGKPVQTQNGDWYMVYLCGRMIGDGYSILGRETALDPITWTEDGWPLVNDLSGPSALQKRPNLPLAKWDSSDLDTFVGEELSLKWMFPRPPEEDAYRLESGQLILKGSVKPLCSVDARNILVQRQRHFNFTASTKMFIPNLQSGQEAGLTCYYDENTWLTFGLTRCEDGSRCLQLKEHIGDQDIMKHLDVPVEDGAEIIFLRVDTSFLKRTFYYSVDGTHYDEFGHLDNVYYLCDEGIKRGKRFTGAMVGLYGIRGDQGLEVAYDWFEYEGEA